MRYAGKTYDQGNIMADENIIGTRTLYVGSGVHVEVVDNPVDSASYFKALDARATQEEKRIKALDVTKTEAGLTGLNTVPTDYDNPAGETDEPGDEDEGAPESKAAAAPANKSRTARTKTPTVDELNA